VNGRPGQAWRGVCIALAGALGMLGAALLVLALFPDVQRLHRYVALAAAFSPYGLVLWPPAAILLLVAARGRARLLALPLIAGLIGHLVVVMPYLPFAAAARGGDGPNVTVLALNMRFGLADLADLERVVVAERPDLVVLTEATAHDATAFEQPRWRALLPYRLGGTGRKWDPTTGAGDPSGTLILATVPIGTPPSDRGEGKFVAGTVDLGGRRITVVAGHPVNPTARVAEWQSDAEVLTRLARAHADAPLIVVGDLNATAEQVTLSDLRKATGVTDTAAGWGWHPTFPADQWFPPLVQIDHVLVSREFRSIGFGTLRVAGTDHLGVVAHLAITGR